MAFPIGVMRLNKALIGRRNKLIVQIIAMFMERIKLIASIRVYIHRVASVVYDKGKRFCRVRNRIQLHGVGRCKLFRDIDEFVSLRKRELERTHRCVFL